MEKQINIITLGDTGVGKTSIIKRIQKGEFDEEIKATVGNDILTLKRPYKKKNLTMLLTFYDTAGQEIFLNILPLQYIRDSHIVLLVFDNINTLKVLEERWYSYYKDNANINDAKFILIGNKSDIFGNEREKIIEKGNKFSEDIDAHFMTCSAKCSDNMDNLERYIITEAKRFIDEEEKKYQNIVPNNLIRRASFNLKKNNKKGINCTCKK